MNKSFHCESVDIAFILYVYGHGFETWIVQSIKKKDEFQDFRKVIKYKTMNIFEVF